MELATIFRELRDPNVTKIQVIPESNRNRSHDLWVTRQVGGREIRERVDITALTQGTNKKPIRGEQARRLAPADERTGPDYRISQAIESKTVSTNRPSQLIEGGRLVVNSMFDVYNEREFAAVAQREMARVAPRLRDRPYVHGIDIVGIDGRNGREEE